MIPGHDVKIASRRETTYKKRWHGPTHCSICTDAIWFSPIALKEPVGAPEPRREWVLCHSCHDALLTQMRRSPIRTPLRLRIAMGLVAAERSPQAYGVRSHLRHVRDQRRFVWIAITLIAAMLLHLGVIIYLATLMK